MSTLRPPGLGPVIGHTTSSSCRLWIRAGDPQDEGARLAADRRTIGIIGLLDDDRTGFEAAYYFRLHREFDRTGTFTLGRDVSLGRHVTDGLDDEADRPVVLTPDTAYTARLATLTIDDPLPDAQSLSSRDLAQRLPDVNRMAPQLLDLPAESCEVDFRTFPPEADVADRLGFLLGSCRYPGLMWKVKKADRIFGPMRAHFEPQDGRPAARFSLMVGDQIYADKLHRLVPVGRADSFEEFQQRYIEAFGSPNMRRLLRTAPTYMILDDHEIEDNWTRDRMDEPGLHRLFNVAVGAYMSYQWSHGPRSFGRRLHYHFDCGGYPFFVLDTRTRRTLDDEGLEDNHLLGHPAIDPRHPGQLQQVLDWLRAQQEQHGDVPKFIASPSVFAPSPIRERTTWNGKGKALDPYDRKHNGRHRNRSDSWPAFPNTRSALLECLLDHEIQNVVFLTGDIHCSNIARLAFAKNDTPRDLRAYDITSSAFYWPFPFADGDPNGFVHDSTRDGQHDGFPVRDHVLHYRAWAFTQEDNFCRIDIDRAQACLTVRYYDRRGDPLPVGDETGGTAVENSLPLAAW